MVAEVAHISEQNAQIKDMQRVYDAQKAAYRAHPMPGAQERIANVRRVKKALLKNLNALEDSLNADFGNRSKSETKMAEIMPSLEGVNYVTKNIKSWMKPSKRKTPIQFKPGKATVYYQPLGVVGIIVPWNYPVFLAIGPLLAALAAGNRVMIKMSEFTPKTSELIKKIIAETYDEDHVSVVTGEAEVGMAFSQLPFDHLLFTGSTSVGRHIMRAASENLTPVTLELGGKSPCIVSDEIPVKDAAERIAFGKCFNAGQTCVAPDYVLIPRNNLEAFKVEFRNVVSSMYPTVKDNVDFTSVVNERQHKRLKSYLEDAKSKGASIEEINPANENFEGSHKIPVTLVSDVNDDMQIMQDEIFGPLMCLVPYDTLDDAINFVNDRPRPLALYYFDYNQERCDFVLNNTHSGGACLNDTILHVAVDDMPFGGIGPSGMGHYHGQEGFLTFSKAKGVLQKGKFYANRFIFPPWDRKIHQLMFKNFLK
jgi:coniferyl-aldehyde dehydrogenase